MDRQKLGQIGKSLANDLENISEKYHSKSNQHEILQWESVGVRGMTSQLLNSEECTYKLLSTQLLREWGEKLISDNTELSERVFSFRQSYSYFVDSNKTNKKHR
ncbi:hypothetical protein MNBD_GAMMA12-91 [hydrothermal vent metagenome]|uniref:Uncharacterized protein n=1 Tax=hydrothermal vent metagenome TaxID=652676 RepID=A0A3B0ZNB8_9ZZZZ